jgi:hypothetical protein
MRSMIMKLPMEKEVERPLGYAGVVERTILKCILNGI